MSQISPNVSSGPYTANGAQTAFAFNFSIIEQRQILVEVDGAPLPTLVGYTVAFGDTSGTVTFTAPPAAGAQILLISNPDYVQTSNFDNQSNYNLATVNLINRRAVIRDLVLKASFDRAVRVPLGEAGLTLPTVAERAGRVQGYDAAGALIAVPNDAVTVAEDLVRAETAANDADTRAAQALDALDQITDLVAQNPTRVSKALDTAVTSSAALINDPDLQVPLGINSLTLLRGNINYSASAAGDLKWRHTGPSSPTAIQIKRRAFVPGATDYSGVAVDTAYSAADIALDGGAGSGFIEFEAVITNGSNAGNFVFEFAQNTSDATATIVKAGSYIEIIPLPVVANFAYSNPAIAALGNFAAASSGGHNYVVASLVTGNSRIEFVATGSKCEIQVNNASGNYTVSIDGGAPVTITPGAGWTFITVFSGLPDAPHRVRISGAFYDTDLTVKLFGFAPSLARPSDIPNFYILGSAPFTTYGVTEGISALNTAIYPAPYQREWGTGGGFMMRFSATTTSVRLWMYNAATPGRLILMQDGVQIADVTPDGLTGGYEIVTLATGLSGSHEYEIKSIQAGRQCDVWALLVDSLDAVAHTAKPLDAHYGDSIAAEISTGGPTFDTRQGDAYLIAQATAHSSILLGQGGAAVSTLLRDGTARVTGLPVLPARVFITAGTNDMVTGVSLATFQADYQTMLTNLRAVLSSGQKIYCRGIIPRVGYTSGAGATTRTNFNARIAAAVTAMGDANIIFVNTDGWIDPTIGVDTVDGTHPNPTGYAKMATAQVAAL